VLSYGKPMPAEKKLKRILVVDDERPLVRALELKFTHSGFDVGTAFDGEEALRKIKEEPFDLVLLDLMLPKVDGFGVMQKLHEEGNKIPVIVTTNLSQEDDAKKVNALGAKAYLVKSDTPINVIVDRVQDALKGI